MKRFFLLFFLLFSHALIAQPRVLALSGSTREDSLNKQLLQEAVELAKQRGAEVTVFDLVLYSMPFYDGDLEAKYGMPPNAKYMRQLLMQSDLVIIASPEYNGSFSAVLKNAIDWTSRGEKGGYSPDAWTGRHVLLLSASPGSQGGKNSLKHLREVLTQLSAQVVTDQVTVPNAGQQLGNRNAPYYLKLRQMIDQLIPQS